MPRAAIRTVGVACTRSFMSRNPLFDQFSRTIPVAWFAEDEAGNGRGARPRRRSWVAPETAPLEARVPRRRHAWGSGGGALATFARPLELFHPARANAGCSVAIV